jgi:hypothetical protein
MRPYIAVVLTALLWAPRLGAAEEWPAYGGPGGRCASHAFDGPMVESWVDARVAWRSDVRIPNGMAGDARKPGRDGEHFVSGGYGSPILANEKLYLQYYVPSGDADETIVAKHGEEFRPKFLLEADDVIHCFDARTGKTLWRTVYEKTSLNMQAFTKGGPSLTCCYGDGRLYAHVNGSRVFALDAKTGGKLWEHRTPRFRRTEELRAKIRATGRIASFNRDYATSPLYVGGALVLNDHFNCKIRPPGDDQEMVYYYDKPSRPQNRPRTVACPGRPGQRRPTHRLDTRRQAPAHRPRRRRNTLPPTRDGNGQVASAGR